MNAEIFDEIVDFIRQNEGHNLPLGCTESEIDELEQKLSIKLPTIYRLFLSRIGKYNGKCFYSDDYQIGIKDFEWNHSYFKDRFEHFGLDIYKDVIAVGSHYKDTIWFIKTIDLKEDPTLFYIRDEGELEINEFGMSFLGFFQREFEACCS